MKIYGRGQIMIMIITTGGKTTCQKIMKMLSNNNNLKYEKSI